MTGVVAGYSMRKWVFEDAPGRYDIDLGDSNIAFATTADLVAPADLELNYGLDRGTPALIRAVADRYDGDTSRVLVTHGAQEALYLLYCTLLRPGDRVIAFRPGWPQAWTVPARLGCRVDILDLTDDFGIDLAKLAAAAGPDVRLITVNSPNNPTGRRIRPHEFAAVTALAQRSDAYIVLDEEYVLDLSTSAAIAGTRIVSVSSISKVYGFPGLRIGWMYGPPDAVSTCAEYKHLTTISNSVLNEALAVGVLSRAAELDRKYRRLTEGGQHLLEQWVVRQNGRVRLVPPEGTPFAWLHLEIDESPLSLARRVLDARVLIMPAETLGATGGIRLTFAREPDELVEGLRRIGDALRYREKKT